MHSICIITGRFINLIIEFFFVGLAKSRVKLVHASNGGMKKPQNPNGTIFHTRRMESSSSTAASMHSRRSLFQLYVYVIAGEIENTWKLLERVRWDESKTYINLENPNKTLLSKKIMT